MKMGFLSLPSAKPFRMAWKKREPASSVTHVVSMRLPPTFNTTTSAGAGTSAASSDMAMFCVVSGRLSLAKSSNMAASSATRRYPKCEAHACSAMPDKSVIDRLNAFRSKYRSWFDETELAYFRRTAKLRALKSTDKVVRVWDYVTHEDLPIGISAQIDRPCKAGYLLVFIASKDSTANDQTAYWIRFSKRALTVHAPEFVLRSVSVIQVVKSLLVVHVNYSNLPCSEVVCAVCLMDNFGFRL